MLTVALGDQPAGRRRQDLATRHGRRLQIDRFAIELSGTGYRVLPSAKDLVVELGNDAEQFDTGRTAVRIHDHGIEAYRELDSATPLYFHADAHQLTFHHDLPKLVPYAARGVIDEQALVEHLAHGLVAGGRTYLHGISQVPLGCRIHWRVTGDGQLNSHKEFADLVPVNGEDAGTVEELLDGVLDQWRRSHHAVMLSGGLDSLLLHRVLYRETTPRPSISADYWFYRDQGPEQRYAATAAAELGAKHHVVVPPRNEFISAMVRATLVAGIPLPGLQSVLIHTLTQAPILSPGTVLISGQGADALFGGPAGRGDWVTAETGIPSHVAWGQACEALGVAGDPSSGRRDAMDLVAGTALTPVDRWRQYQLVAHTDKGMITWAASAKLHRNRIVYPYLNPKVAAWAKQRVQRLHFSKPELSHAAERLGVPPKLIYRPKLSFGPTGTGWASQLRSASTLCESLVNRKAVHNIMSSSDYTYWNLLTFSMWYRLHILGEAADELIETCIAPRHGKTQE